MTVKLAKTAGFCWGVKRAMDMALKVSSEEDAPIRTLGPLIHNRQAIDLLKSKRIGQIDDPESATDNSMVIIRAHGITPEMRQRIVEQGARVCDATCPHVIRAQRLVERHTREGYDAIIIGDRDHAETVGIKGHAVAPGEGGQGGRAFVIESLEELDDLPDELNRLVVVAQTTQERGRFERVSARLMEMYPEAKIHNTVCSDASNRQAELKELADEVDAMVVVGGRHSANTNRLAQMARDAGTPTWLVETADELDCEALKTFKHIGVTAGASTPQWIISLVVERLKALEESKRPAPIRAAVAVVRFLVVGQFYLATGAALLTWAAFALLGLPVQWLECAFASLFALSMHQFHHYLNQMLAPSLLHGPIAYFYSHRHVYLLTCGIAVIGSLTCAIAIHWLYLLLALTGFAGGALYSWATRPSESDFGWGRWVRHVRGSKDLFMAGAWSAVAVVGPFISAWFRSGKTPIPPNAPSEWISFFLAAAMIFLLVLIRSVLIDLRDIDDDLLVGRDTLPTALGMKVTARLITVALVLFTLTLTASLGWSLGPRTMVWAAPAVGLLALNAGLIQRRVIRQGAFWDALMDGPIWLTALCVVAAQWLAG